MNAEFEKENSKIAVEQSNKFNELSTLCKVLRDPIHGDIFLTDLESMIIDTKAFQRLRSIKQLGLAHLVYPGANHTRFAHSIGTLHMAQKIVDAINKNPFHRATISDSYQVALTRIYALLYNILSIPFGHTIEEEGNLVPQDWRDRERIEYFLGSESEIGQIVLKTTGQEFLDDLKALLAAEKDDEIKPLKYPFISDIVKNGLCADLLDYISRDAYHAGLRESFDSRILNYLIIQDREPEKARLVLNPFRRGKIRLDVVSEFIHLLRTYYSLAERIYFHRTTLSASAMLMKAVAATPWMYTKGKSYLLELRDDELLYELEKNGSNATKYIISRLRRRQLYKPIYTIRPYDYDQTSVVAKVVGELRHKFRNPTIRCDFEQKIEEQNNLPSGSIILYSSPLSVTIPAAKTRILWQNDVYTIDKIPNIESQKEINVILNHYRKLFQIFVFMDSELTKHKPLTRNVIQDCQRSLRVPVVSTLDGLPSVLVEEQLRERDIIGTLEKVMISKGFNIIEEQRLPGSPGYIADLVARKGEQYYVFEVKGKRQPPDEQELVNYLDSIRKVYDSYLKAKFNVLSKEPSQEQIRGEVYAFLVLVDIKPSKDLTNILRKAGIGLVLLSSEELWKISQGLVKPEELSITGLN